MGGGKNSNVTHISILLSLTTKGAKISKVPTFMNSKNSMIPMISFKIEFSEYIYSDDFKDFIFKNLI